MSFTRGDRVYVRPAPPSAQAHGSARKYVDVPATVRKCNGTSILIELTDGRVVWVRKATLERIDG